MKMMYEKPVMEVELFQANEFFAACNGAHPVYEFACDAGDEVPGWIFIDSNNNGELDNNEDQCLGQFTSCGDTHDAPVTDDFQKGFYRPMFLEASVPVMVWTDNDKRIHATTKVDMEQWETLKS